MLTPITHAHTNRLPWLLRQQGNHGIADMMKAAVYNLPDDQISSPLLFVQLCTLFSSMYALFAYRRLAHSHTRTLAHRTSHTRTPHTSYPYTVRRTPHTSAF